MPTADDGAFDEFFVPGGVLAGPLARAMRDDAPALHAAPGDQVDRYRLLRLLARGGMGVVFLAERSDGAYVQQVALKLLHGPADPQQARRMAVERQLLAKVSHPHIAALLDGGVDERHGPYIVMEYVEGQPIDLYCDAQRLDVDQRVRLVITACEAVSFAHGRLVVHRDLKPSNVFVCADGTVKLLDFGIARLAEGAEGVPGAPATQQAFTPEYAAPEQLRGEGVTTATDVFQLGLLLYELLAGRRAQEFGSGAVARMVQVVCHEDTRPPSAVVRQPGARGQSPGELAAVRRTTPAALARRLAGDLDAIVEKALRKEPDRRYASVAELADDLRCWQIGLPVRARRHTLRYRAGKFVRRHRLGLTAAVLVLLSLAAGLGTTLWQARLARLQAQRADEVKRVLLSLFDNVNPDTAEDAALSARELVARAVRDLEALDGQPELASELLWVAGVCYHRLGLVREARPLLERAYALRVTLHGTESVEAAEALGSLGELAYSEGRVDDAIMQLRAALATLELHAETPPEKLSSLTTLLSDALALERRYDEALDLLRRRVALEEARRPSSASLARLYGEIGAMLADTSGRSAAEPWYQRAIEIEERAGRRSVALSQALHNLAAWRYDQGRFDESEALLRRALELRERRYGPDDFAVASTRGHLGMLIERRGDLDQAERIYRDVLRVLRARRKPGDPAVAEFTGALGKLLCKRGQAADAWPFLREARDAQRASPDAFDAEERHSLEAALAVCGAPERP